MTVEGPRSRIASSDLSAPSGWSRFASRASSWPERALSEKCSLELSRTPLNQPFCKADWPRLAASPPGPIFVYSPSTSAGDQPDGPNGATIPAGQESQENAFETPDPPTADSAAQLTCHHSAASTSPASVPLPRDWKRRFRHVVHPHVHRLLCPFLQPSCRFPPCRAPHHPSSFVGFDRNPPFQESVHFSSPVGRDLPVFQIRNCPFACFLAKLKLVYSPRTGREIPDSAGAWKGPLAGGICPSSR